MSTKLNVETFIAVLRKSGLVERDRLEAAIEAYWTSGGSPDDPVDLSNRLIGENLVTRWQVEKLLQGKHRGYFLGKYKLLSLLGKGGMSSVYLAEHLLLRRRCALKVLPAKRVDDSSYLERFHREAQAVASLDHPNIVRAFDVDHQSDGDRQIHFLVMEHVDGQSLQELVPRKGLPSFLDAAEYTRQAAAGLQHAHEQGMIHRDIKPGNLLVDPNGVVKILDLGLARFFTVDEGDEALTIRHDEKVLGTADYLAPEQALDSHTVDVRADIYSLGCTLYFMLTGQPPFTEGTLAQRLMAHQVKTPPSVESLRPDTPPSLAAIIRKMMEKKPADRYTTANETEKILFKWIDENADEAWRKAHAGVYGSRSVESGSVAKAVPIAQPVPVAQPIQATLVAMNKPSGQVTKDSSGKLASKPTSSNSGKLVSKPTSSKTKLPKTPAASSSNLADTAINQFFSTLAEPRNEPAQTKSDATSPHRGSNFEESGGIDLDLSEVTPIRPSAAASSSIFSSFKSTGREQAAIAKPVTNSDSSLSQKSNSRILLSPSIVDTLKGLSIPVQGGIAAACLLLAVIVIYSLSGLGGQSGAKGAKPVINGPFPKDKHEVTVGGPKSEYASIREALTAVRNRYQSKSGTNDTFIVRISGGTYKEQVRIDGRNKPWLEGITLLGEGQVQIESADDGPVIRLASITRFAIENIQVSAKNQPIAIELADDLQESRLSKVVVSGFTETGVLCKGTQGLAFGNNQVFLDQLTIETNNAQAIGIRIQEGADNDVNNLIIRGCRFFGPMAAGIVIEGRAPYGISIRESIFNQTTNGIRIDGQPLLKSIYVTNNSFRQTKTGIRFSKFPSDLSSDLAFRRNLFVGTEVAEALVQEGYDAAKLRSMFSNNPPGIENNLSDRAIPTAPANGEIAFIFEQGGRQNEKGIAFTSTDPKDPKFLAPAEKSPQREVGNVNKTDEKPQLNDKQWVGAIGP